MRKERSLWQSMVMATLLGIGFGILWVLGGAWLATVESEWRTTGTVREGLVIRSDGTPVIEYYTLGSYRGREHRHLDGTPLEITSATRWAPAARLEKARREPAIPSRAFWSGRIRSVSDASKPPIYWYLVHDGRQQGAAYFVGYDSRAKAKVGYIGTTGFCQYPPPESERFRVAARDIRYYQEPALISVQEIGQQGAYPNWDLRYAGILSLDDGSVVGQGNKHDWPATSVFLAAGGVVFNINVQNRRVQTLYETSNERPVVAIAHLLKYEDDSQGMQRLTAIRMPDQIVFINPQGERAGELSLPAELQNVTFNWYVLDNGEAIATTARYDRTSAIQYETIHRINEQGKIYQQQEVKLCNGQPPWGGRYATSLGVLLCPAPLVITTFMFVVGPLTTLASGQAISYGDIVRDLYPGIVPGLLAIYLLAIVLAWQCYRRQRRYARSGKEVVVWTIFVLLLGLPGYFGYLLHCRWPVQETCPSCNRTVPRDQPTCARCQTAFPEPERIGTEVFA